MKIKFYIIILITINVFCFADEKLHLPEGAFPATVYSLTNESPISAAYLNNPITEKDRIYVSKEGHLQTDSGRLRIFGTNLSEFPQTKEKAIFAAEALANQGYNCIRFHHTDADWTNCFIKTLDNKKRVLNKTQLKAFDFFFAELKKRGIYSNINFLTGRVMTSADGYKPEINQIKNWKHRHCLGFWNKDARQKQKDYIDELMNHVNPYTGLAYKDDPAVAIVEINNENGLLMGYLSGWLDEYKGEYWQELESLWNDWLKKNHYSYSTLSKTYNKSSTPAEYLVAPDSKWYLERHNGAEAALSTKKNETTIKIINNGTEGWHIQYSCSKLNMHSDNIYTIKFSAKASKDINIDVGLSQAHDPWKNAGWYEKISLSSQWQDFEYTVENIMDDDNLRLIFGGMGFASGTTISLKNISLQEGGTINLIEKSPLGIKLPYYYQYKRFPDDLKNLIMNFMWETEADYWIDMKNYIHDTLDSKALVMGTIIGCSTPMLQNCFDIIDTHAYWNHPVFPTTDWDIGDYYVKNTDLTRAAENSTLTSLAKMRIYGKPFSCSEYDHPYPNQYNSEAYPMISSFGAFQDWDCIFTFCYTLPKTKNGKSEKITGFFDQGNTPSKTFAAPIASRIFRQFLVTPGEKKYYIDMNTEIEKKGLYKNHSWSIGNPVNYGSNQKVAFTHQLGIVVEENNTPLDDSFINLKNEIPADISLNSKFSDTNEIYYDFDSGIYLVCNDKVTISVINKDSKVPDFPSDWKKVNRLLPMTETKDFSTVAAVNEDGKYLLFNCSWCGNAAEELHVYKTDEIHPIIRDFEKLTTVKTLGTGPSYALAADGKMELFGKKEIILKSSSGNLWQIITTD